MYNKSKNKLLFVIFVFIVLLIIAILILAVYTTKKGDIEEYKISPNTITYDENYDYVYISDNAVLKKEWNDNYYLNYNSNKYSLGTESVIYNKSKNQVTVYGDVYQVYSNGDINKKTKKTVISNVSDFQFFKLNDRKYLLIGDSIGNNEFSTKNYLVVSIDRSGNALLVNNEINVKTINPLIINIESAIFDVANEKVTIEEQVIDLKKINGSTNEYVEKTDEDKQQNANDDSNNENSNNTNDSNQQNNNTNNNSQIYNDIVNQIVNISGLLANQNKTNLYKNISLRGIDVGATYLVVNYSIIDPEEKYLNIFITLIDQDDNEKKYNVNKNSSAYRIMGLKPNSQYKVQISYVTNSSKTPVLADSIIVLTNSDPTVLRITKIKGATEYHYNIKMYNENEFSSAKVALTDCEGNILTESKDVDILNSLTPDGSVGMFTEVSFKNPLEYVCLKLVDVVDAFENSMNSNSYHKIKIN